MSATYVPLVAAVGAPFGRQRLVAVGLAVSGIGVGTLVMAPVVAWLIAELGWRSAYGVLGVAGGAVLLGCAALVAPPPRTPHQRRPLGESLRTLDYRLVCLAQGLSAVALFVPFAQLPAYAEESGSNAVAVAGPVGVIGGASVVAPASPASGTSVASSECRPTGRPPVR